MMMGAMLRLLKQFNTSIRMACAGIRNRTCRQAISLEPQPSIEINLNCHIRFKPTEYGKIIYKAYWMPYQEGKVTGIELDRDGWADMQIWSFMSIFGPHFHGGMNVPIETTVVFYDKDKALLEKLRQQVQ